MHAEVGDEIVVDSRSLGGPVRKGEVLEVRPGVKGEHFVVRWDDGHESIFFPGSDSHIVQAARDKR